MFVEDDEAPDAQNMEYMSKRLLMRKHHVAGMGTHAQFYDQFVTPGLVAFGSKPDIVIFADVAEWQTR